MAESITTTNKIMDKLSKQYAFLLMQAEATNSRQEALALIHRADAIRQEMTQLDQQHPVLH